MEVQPTSESSNRLLSGVLKCGLILSLVCVAMGGGFFLWECFHCVPDFHDFHGEPHELKSIQNVFAYALTGNSLGIIQLGILFLIATPLLRVIACVAVFAQEHDSLYVMLALIVLLALFYSIL